MINRPMRFLRLLSNSALAGSLAAAFITILVLQLNPGVPVGAGAIPLVVVLLLTFGVHGTVAWYVVLVLEQVLTTDPPSPGWVSLRLLSIAAPITTGAATVLMSLNARGFVYVLDPEAQRRMTAGAVVVAACTVVFVLIAVVHRRAVGRRAVRAGLFVATLAVATAGPIVLRGPGAAGVPPSPPGISSFRTAEGPPQPRVTMLLLDGASLDVVTTAVAGGRLPNFGRVLDGGAALYLASLRPTQPEPVWTAVATGKWPSKNGIRSAAVYRARGGGDTFDLLPDHCFSYALVRFGFLDEQRHASSAVRASPVWRILDAHGYSVGVIGWPVTNPAPRVQGYVISDVFLRTLDSAVEIQDHRAVYPPDIADEMRLAVRETPPAIPDTMLAASTPLSRGDDRQPRTAALEADGVYRHLAKQLQSERATRFSAVHFQGLDAIGHYYLRYAEPWAFGDVTDDERRLYGRVLEQQYAAVDVTIGHIVASLGPDDLLLVVSGFGMEPLSPVKRLFERLVGNALLSGTHERAPDGFLIAYGGGVQPGRRSRGSIVDVAPTILYYLGLPVGRDMDGYVRTDLFARRFTDARPIAFIPSYDR